MPKREVAVGRHARISAIEIPRQGLTLLTSFGYADLLNVDNYYIVITNADQFKAADLEVLKNMVILLDDDSDHASFENGEQFYAEGEMTKVSLSSVDTSLSFPAH